MIFDGPINNLSIGNVSVNFLRELIKRGKLDAVFPVGDNADFSAYNSLDPYIRDQIVELARNRIKNFKRDIPTLKVWHINGSEKKPSDKQYLYTFYETDEPTIEEINIVAQQEHVFFSSSESAEYFKMAGLNNVSYVPLGFDKDFYKIEDQEFLGENVIHFGICGKWEKRKNTERIIKLWLEKYGNDKRYVLSCLVDNPFFKPEIMDQLKIQAMGGKHYSNINWLPHLKTNSEVNQFINSLDIDLSGCNFNEGWNLPSFNAACLGKVCVVGNGGAHKDWARGDNIIKLEPEGKEPCYDGVFFNQGGPFNQGNFYKVSDESISNAMDRALKFKEKYKEEERRDLQEEFSYEKTLDKIGEVIYS